MTNIQAAIGCAQLEHIEEFTEKRRLIYERYKKNLEGQDGLIIQQITNHVKPVIWAFALYLEMNFFPQGRDKVISQMHSLGIETRPGFYTPYTIKYFNSEINPISEDISSFKVFQ